MIYELFTKWFFLNLEMGLLYGIAVEPPFGSFIFKSESY